MNLKNVRNEKSREMYVSTCYIEVEKKITNDKCNKTLINYAWNATSFSHSFTSLLSFKLTIRNEFIYSYSHIVALILDEINIFNN